MDILYKATGKKDGSTVKEVMEYDSLVDNII